MLRCHWVSCYINRNKNIYLNEEFFLPVDETGLTCLPWDRLRHFAYLLTPQSHDSQIESETKQNKFKMSWYTQKLDRFTVGKKFLTIWNSLQFKPDLSIGWCHLCQEQVDLWSFPDFRRFVDVGRSLSATSASRCTCSPSSPPRSSATRPPASHRSWLVEVLSTEKVKIHNDWKKQSFIGESD